MSIQERIQHVEQRIAEACERSGRRREDINVIAVTKYVSVETTISAYKSGLLNLGENRWQDAEQKWKALSKEAGQTDEDSPSWHFIGSLQTNKAKDVIGKFSYIHSLDRLSLAEAMHKRASQLGITVPCFIQVNVSGEDSKHGMEPGDLMAFIEALQAYPALKPIGLMTMAPYESKPEETRVVFRALRELRDDVQMNSAHGSRIVHLSMGMSNDFDVAIEEGATWIRLGTILVGKEEE
ncbi:YggS family pyridoxal phosphate-dependent enzyme [Paenibacillus sp. GSMTC-2017]|uniref:YggS family pyridoxal phosphate-dependent enzyme n=1 Tax=Paenibacillus sp. GSMTC-2017 TaxID=2794350 RepID=UPI0018D9F218|nr:YggS family pyridoxal phosphate-dependent enzyme [Paenibacillus sp. GSMTC-2017]MBH5316889.1 YggS family pyridoxal phosphate-dependent enzyme [Paenibacillus sp. GSMTC-2017]